MSQETEFLPWRTAINRLSYLIEMLDTSKVYGQFQNYLTDLIKPLYDQLGWEVKENDTWLQKYIMDTYIFFLLLVTSY
jgi:hypothetical protein